MPSTFIIMLWNCPFFPYDLLKYKYQRPKSLTKYGDMWSKIEEYLIWSRNRSVYHKLSSIFVGEIDSIKYRWYHTFSLICVYTKKLHVEQGYTFRFWWIDQFWLIICIQFWCGNIGHRPSPQTFLVNTVKQAMIVCLQSEHQLYWVSVCNVLFSPNLKYFCQHYKNLGYSCGARFCTDDFSFVTL